MVQRFLLALRSRGGVVSRTIAIAVARALITRNPQYNLGHVKVDSYWAQSLFRRMGFKRRMRTTGKVEIEEKLNYSTFMTSFQLLKGMTFRATWL